MPYFKKNEGFSLGFSPYTRGDASPFKSTPASRIKDAKRNAKFDYRNAIAGTRDPQHIKQARKDYKIRMQKIREREKNLRVPKKFKSPFKWKSMPYSPGPVSASMVKWDLETGMRRKKKEDEAYAKWKEKKKKKKAARKAKKNSPFTKKARRTINPFDRHERVDQHGLGGHKRRIKRVKNRPQEGGAGGGPKDMEMWAKRNRG
tara:strand:- start:2730 stop:3338 length:609 start_codon:yes stop_codon:yes gene_type:complete